MTCRAVLLFTVFALALPDPMRAAQPKKPAIDVSGTWALIATSKGPPGMPDGVMFRATVTLKQLDVMEGSKPAPLDGYFSHQDGSGAAFTGIVQDKTVTFTAVYKNSQRPGVTNIADFTGTLDGDGTIKGRVTGISTGPGTYMRGEGSFVATRR